MTEILIAIVALLIVVVALLVARLNQARKQHAEMLLEVTFMGKMSEYRDTPKALDLE